jgi:oxygen-independent coproporphyrinogen-3 oxidase
LSDEELARLMTSLRRAFQLAPGAEISIEVDPRTASAERLAFWRGLGFNRLSFGVQDFDAEVQKAVHRVQSFESVRDLVRSARELGYESVNVDLIYGLPKQNPASFARRSIWSASCGRTASRCMPTRICRSDSSLSGASTRRSCPRRRIG